MDKNIGEKYLDKIYKDLHLSEPVMHTASKSDSKEEKIKKYLDRLSRIEFKVVSKGKKWLRSLKRLYYNKYIIKEEDIPESYFELQKRIALERGYGYVEINDRMRNDMIKSVIEEQKKSLDIWIDYLVKEDSLYPEWFKYFVFQGMVKLGNYDKKTGKYSRRTSSTTSPFIELNRESLSLMYDSLVSALEGHSLDDNKLELLIKNGSFSKLYSYINKRIDGINKNIVNDDGVWVKYDMGSDSKILAQSLQGKGTGWCTAGFGVAEKQLRLGDFYVYYTKDSIGNYTQPRIAIRMIGKDKIEEIRGIGEHQNLEPEMEIVLSDKLKEFSDGERYTKKTENMEKLTRIHNEHKTRDLTIDEIKFIYEVEGKIEGFGYEKDPRIKEIVNERNLKKDLSLVFNCSEDEISDDQNDIVEGKDLIFFYGDYYFGRNLKSVSDTLRLPKIISGDIDLRSLKDARNVVFPDIVYGSLSLDSLQSTKGLKLPFEVSGSLYLHSVERINKLVFPKKIGKNLCLNSLKKVGRIVLPEYVGGNLNLDSLTSIKGVIMPNYMGGNINLRSLNNTEGLELPDTVNGSLYLNSIKDIGNLTLPRYVADKLYLDSIETSINLVLPEYIGCFLFLDSLKSTEGLVLPETLKGSLFIRSITNLDGITLPNDFGGRLFVDSLEIPNDLANSSNYNSVENMINYINSLIAEEKNKKDLKLEKK